MTESRCASQHPIYELVRCTNEPDHKGPHSYRRKDTNNGWVTNTSVKWSRYANVGELADMLDAVAALR